VVINSGDGLKTLDAVVDRVGPDHHDPAPLRGVHRVLEGSSAMSATVRIPTILRTFTSGPAR
jgi:hypothetical protein